ncbi:MAG: methyltransferase domain-containing protein [Blastocatellia bacterium]
MDDPVALRQLYEKHGAREYYERFGAEYSNPHEPVIREALREAVARWGPDLSEVLDLACGSGEATLALETLGATEVGGIDPYTQAAYLARTGRVAEGWSFAQIASGALAGRRYSLVVCSFAMHLAEASRLPALLVQLGAISDRLLILTPHKRPEIRPAWGWRMEDEFILERVRVRLYHAR